MKRGPNRIPPSVRRLRLDAAAAQLRSLLDLSLYRRNRWERLPFEGTPGELVDVMNTALAHWAVEW